MVKKRSSHPTRRELNVYVKTAALLFLCIWFSVCWDATKLDQYEAIIEGEGDVDDSNDDANDGKKSAIGSLKSKSVCQLKNTVVDGDTRLHLVLVIQNCNTAWNRDINASNSIHLLACCLIDGVERPTVFCRPTTTTITTMGTATAIDTTKATNTPTVREN